jgi:hypothetical protein
MRRALWRAAFLALAGTGWAKCVCSRGEPHKRKIFAGRKPAYLLKPSAGTGVRGQRAPARTNSVRLLMQMKNLV